ncbi:hypothetical protein MKW94_021415 [Papaver nudicaule]|uniref:Peptidase S26 domain-containing protein n=1 Tax=Papaver nudicaule TaxID=74823 RepID=A0AA41SF00_PAPNU|nr:hypothetical protein [Papaver nudicaule]MCL7035352.1 hypothetical protein [Papaver nudicaule]
MNGLRNLLKYKSIAKEAIIAGELLCILHVTNTYICTLTLGHGPSMLPTLNLTGDWILAEKISTPRIQRNVPKGHVWIQGDNIYSSNDSRHFGSIPYGLVQGKVFFRVSFV